MTVLIKNVQIIGAARPFPERSDVFVNNDKISAIGNFSHKKADLVIDGQGAYLSPGFIDVNTGSDHYLSLFNDPSQEHFIRQGVTSIFGGMCGASLAPLLYGSLESLQKWSDTDKINVNWHTMAEFIEVMAKKPPAVNFGTLVGHSTIRRAIIGESLRDLTKNELGVFSRTLESSISEGAFGLSTGLGYVHTRKTPYAELRALAEIVKKFRGVYATHLRQEAGGIKESVEETIKLVKDTGVSALISHFVPVLGSEKEYEAALDLIESLPAEVALRFDVHPSPLSLVPLYTLLPEWVQTGGVKVMTANINDEWLLPRIKKDIPAINGEDVILAHAPGNEFLVGKSLREIKDIYEMNDERDALLKLMQTLRLKGSVLHKNLNPDLILRAINSKRSFIGSDTPSIAQGEEGAFSGFLSLIQEHKSMSLEDAIKKITIEPAKKFGLIGRGEIKEGNFADLVCFRGAEIKFTIVNGGLVEKESEFQSVLPGRVLRHSLPKR